MPPLGVDQATWMLEVFPSERVTLPEAVDQRTAVMGEGPPWALVMKTRSRFATGVGLV